MGDVDQDQKTSAIQQWMKTQPHLPQDFEVRLIRRFLHSCYYDLEKTKTCLEHFFTIRSSIPDILSKRDPGSKEMEKYLKIFNLSCLKISGNRNLWLWQLNDPGLETYDYAGDARTFFMCGDLFLLEDDFLEDADVVIMDVKDISLKFLTKINLSMAKKLAKFQQEGMPIRLKQIHAYNAPAFIDKLYAVIKPFMKQEYNQMIHFHKPNSETLYKFLDREELPEDFGGTAGRMEDLMKVTVEQFMKHRNFFVNPNPWKSDESKRVKNSKTKNGPPLPADTTADFRSLAID